MKKNNHPLNRTQQSSRSGSLLLEMTVALGLLTAIGMFLLIGTLDLMPTRQWTIRQNMTDAYLTYEEAVAKRVPFDVFLTRTDINDGPVWLEYPSSSKESVDLGTAPGGKIITGTIIRTRIPNFNNLDAAGTIDTNPAEMETWKLQSILTFNIGTKEYYKSRTVIRTR